MSTTPRYRCPICNTIVEDDDMPVCNKTDRCGFLYEDDLVPAVAVPTRKALKFKLDGEGFLPGDDRPYTVHYRGHTIGTVEPTYLVSRFVDGPPVSGWAFISDDRRYSGEGRNRADAVIDAYTRGA